jgi:UDP-MurNAc hydroxylase
MRSVPKLTFINHAGFCLEYNDICLAIDPWIEGAVFNNSWSLISPTPQTALDCLKTATHVWFSHEHPDHFNPPDVRKYLTGKRFLFQKTIDKRVVSYLSEIGASVTELDFGEPHTLGDDFSIRVYPFGRLDSYCVIEIGDITILNLNDCYIKDDDEIDFIRTLCPKVDILFFQFSYAVGHTNRDQSDARSRLAKNKLSQLKKTIDRFKPRYTCPFASFVYFSSSDNFYLNDSVNRIDNVLSEIDGATVPLCFYPGDQWAIGDKVDNADAIAKYLRDYSRIAPKTGMPAQYPAAEILAKIDAYLVRTKRNNPLWPLYYYRRPEAARIRFEVIDTGATIDFDFRTGGSTATGGFDRSPVCKLNSDALMNLFSFDWGYDTLHIGGRYEADSAAQKHLANVFRFSTQNYQGAFYDLQGAWRLLRERFRTRPKYLPSR